MRKKCFTKIIFHWEQQESHCDDLFKYKNVSQNIFQWFQVLNKYKSKSNQANINYHSWMMTYTEWVFTRLTHSNERYIYLLECSIYFKYTNTYLLTHTSALKTLFYRYFLDKIESFINTSKVLILSEKIEN